MNFIKPLVGYLLFLTLLSVSSAAMIVVYQSSFTIDVIEVSLSRHVEQYLIEKPTQEIVTRELTTLHAWLLWLSGLLFIGTIMMGVLLSYTLKLKTKFKAISNATL